MSLMPDRRTAVLLERDDELRELDRLVGDVCAGRGRLVLIEGPPGIGKTRLLETARAEARRRGMTVLAARASELDREFPFGVVRQLFEPLIATAEEGRRALLLRGAAGLAGPLLGGGGAPRGGAAAPGAGRVGASAHAESAGAAQPEPAAAGSLAFLHALYWLTANLAEDGPAALAIDDLHWADPSSLRFLQFLAPRLEELPVLLTLATRPHEPGLDRRAIDALATDPLATVLRPGPLSGDAVARLVAAELGSAPDGRFSAACREATGGNPFLVGELLRELSAEGVEPIGEREPLVRQLAPPTVARAVLLRLARLGADASALARAVAVLGDGAPIRRACKLAGLPEERGDELATALAGADILAAARPLAFAHPILRSAVYADIDAADRARAHRRAAALAADDGAAADAIAVHLLATEPAADPYVVETLREAARTALARGAPGVAVACLRRALAEPPPPADHGRIAVELGSAEMHAGDPAAAADHFAEAARVTGDPRERASSAWEHGAALQALGRYDEAYAVRERAVEEVAELDPELALLAETSIIASASVDLSRLEWARERVERHRGRLPVAAPAQARLLAIQAFLGAFYGETPAAELADAAERALASGGLGDERGMVTTPFFVAVEVLWLADRIEPARRALDERFESARRRGSALGFACISGWRARLLARQGELAEAEADARSCAELALPQGWFGLAPPMLGYVLDVLVERGELDDAERLLDRAGMAGVAPGDDLTLYPLVHARARLRAARGDVAGGRVDLASLERRHARWNTDDALRPASLAAPELAGGDPEAARAGAERMLDDARTWGTPRAAGMALHAAGLAQEGARGLELLEEAVAELERSPARLARAHALTDLGAALRRAGRRGTARETLRRALDLATACGAGPLAERARRELRAAGARPRRPRMSGVEALTASERRIAAMAAGGLSNREIAQALFVTTKTVEAHLGGAYRKLDIRSRAQLAAALGDNAAGGVI
jgi:DNA-binding CsgD family transcriptional regulator